MSLGQKKQPTISLPEFRKPTPPSFEAYGQKSSFDGNTYKLSEDPAQQADRLMAERIRRDLLSSLGLSSGSMSDPYAALLRDESLRLSQPRLENSLIQRGLGGSSVYGQALAELISRASTEAALGSNDMKLRNLAGIQSSYLLPYLQMGQNLLGLTANAGEADAARAASMYTALLPYTAKVEYPKKSGLAGLISGAMQGGQAGAAGGPMGMIVGAAAGGATGYYGSKEDAYSEPLYLSQYGQANKNNSALQLLQLLGQSGGGAF